MFAVQQPRHYGSRFKAKDPALFMVMRGPTVDDPYPHRTHLACFGNKRHYHRETGICVHVEEFAHAMKPWYRKRAKFLRFGESGRRSPGSTGWTGGRIWRIPGAAGRRPLGERQT